MQKGISIIIPTYNGGRVFSKCLEMIMRQDYGGEIELIVVDSGSTDGTIELAERVGAFIRPEAHVVICRYIIFKYPPDVKPAFSFD